VAAALQQALGAQVQAIAAKFLSRKARPSQMPPSSSSFTLSPDDSSCPKHE